MILDLTLKQLHAMFPQNKQTWSYITFSPSSSVFTAYSRSYVMSWDLQTGGLLSSSKDKKITSASQCHVLGVK